MAGYYLMHGDIKCGELEYDTNGDRIVSYHDFQTGCSPYMGNIDYAKMQKWWLMRAVPASRAALQDILRDTGCTNAGNYLAKNLALSMTDAYWICPKEMDISYDTVRLSNFAVFHDGKIPYHNATSYDPNASLGGQMDKYWDLSEKTPVLVKESYRYFGLQAINEAFATHIHEMQNSGIPFVKYRVYASEDRGLLCKCRAFTSETMEFVPAYEVIESQKVRNDTALYDGYLNICASIGIDRESMQNFMDYQTLTDFIISNTDEHLLNFGILRNPDTMQYLGPAPIFDSGNSMFFSDKKKMPYTRVELLERKITSFYKSEEQMLKKVQNKNIVRLDLLPSPREIKDFYSAYGIPEWKADIISRNYASKLDFAKEFQQGKTISLYKEKQTEKAQKNIAKATMKEQKFVMFCGLPGSGKTQQAEQLLEEYKLRNLREVDAKEFFPLSEALSKTKYMINTEEILSLVQPKSGYHKTVAMISLSNIRKEIAHVDEYNDFAFMLAEARVKGALLSGTIVIYDATNLRKDTRSQFLQIAMDVGINNTELHVLNTPLEQLQDIGIDDTTLREMQSSLNDDFPDYEEGWAQIKVSYAPEHEIEK